MAWYGFFLLGIVAGLILGVLIDRDTVNKYYNKIRKVKIKKSPGVSDVIDINTNISMTKKELRQRKRQIRRENRSRLNSNE